MHCIPQVPLFLIRIEGENEDLAAMALSVSPQGLRFPPTLLPSPPKPRSRIPSARSASLFRPPSTALSIRYRGPARRSDVVRSPVVAGASASGISPDVSDVLGDVRIFTAAGEPVLFKDLWDQNEVSLRSSFCTCQIFFIGDDVILVSSLLVSYGK